MKGNQAYRFALDPTPVQEQRFRSHTGAARSAWNWGLDQCRKRSETEKKWESGVDLHRLWNVEKKRNPKLAWWKENATCAGSLPHPGLGAGELHHVQEGRAEGTTNRLPPAQAEGAMPGLLPLRHRGDALLGDHGHPAQVGHHRGPPRSQLRGDPLRLDALHQATTMLASRYATVGVEDLNVVGRLRNRRLARPLPTRPSGWCGTSLAPRPPGVVAGPSSPSASSLAPRPALGVGR